MVKNSMKIFRSYLTFYSMTTIGVKVLKTLKNIKVLAIIGKTRMVIINLEEM